MDQRISFVTLAVADLDATRTFYVDGLGWQPELDVPGEVLMFRTGEHLVLSLWERSHFAAEVGEPTMSGIAPITLAHNLATKEAVDTVLATARRAGADPAPTRWSATGAATPATSATPTATGGRSPTTRARSGSWCCPDRTAQCRGAR